MSILEPVALGPATARNRIVFGPHETNLARGRSISDRHVAYYGPRARGGAGVIVTEEASVHPSDWPYERAPLASACGAGWAAVADACRPHGSLVIAAIGHAGGQGASAYSQAPLWAPSRIPEVNTREVPKAMEAADIAAVIEGFGAAAALAVRAGCDGVEVNGGQHSLLRQFLSGLTNQRSDEWGNDRLSFARSVLTAVRDAAGPQAVVGLRLSCDELAPWAGIVPSAGAELAASLAGWVDYVTVVRGSIFTVSATRPDGHTEPGFNLDLAGLVRSAVPPGVAVIAQGSIVDFEMASAAVAAGRCDAVEMTRAQIADPSLVLRAGAGEARRIRPCILCNQACQVRDARNPIVSCVVEPSSGHEWEDPEPLPATAARDVLVVGGGVAGLECARVAALAGHRVTVAERSSLGGTVPVAATGAGRSRLAAIVPWLIEACTSLGVVMKTGWDVTAADTEAWDGPVVLCTGSLPGRHAYEGPAVTAADFLAEQATPQADPAAPRTPSTLAVWDPIGGPIGISVASLARAAGSQVHLITPDLIAGNELSRTGDLAPANVRLLGAGVNIEKRSILRAVRPGLVEVEDRFTGVGRSIPADLVVDAGYRLPDDGLWRATGGRLPRAGDAVAPRSIHEAILEGRRVALSL